MSNDDVQTQMFPPEMPPWKRHHRRDPDTSVAAAELHPLLRSGIRLRVAEILRQNPEGLTDDEIHAFGTGTRHRHSTATRRGELVSAGLVEQTTGRRINADGNAEVVWRATANLLLEKDEDV